MWLVVVSLAVVDMHERIIAGHHIVAAVPLGDCCQTLPSSSTIIVDVLRHLTVRFLFPGMPPHYRRRGSRSLSNGARWIRSDASWSASRTARLFKRPALWAMSSRLPMASPMPRLGHRKMTCCNRRDVAAFKQRLGEGKPTARGDKIRNRLSGLLAHKYVKTAQKEAARQELASTVAIPLTT